MRCRKGRVCGLDGQWRLALVPGTCHSHVLGRMCLLGGGGSSYLVLVMGSFP